MPLISDETKGYLKYEAQLLWASIKKGMKHFFSYLPVYFSAAMFTWVIYVLHDVPGTMQEPKVDPYTWLDVIEVVAFLFIFWLVGFASHMAFIHYHKGFLEETLRVIIKRDGRL